MRLGYRQRALLRRLAAGERLYVRARRTDKPTAHGAAWVVRPDGTRRSIDRDVVESLVRLELLATQDHHEFRLAHAEAPA